MSEKNKRIPVARCTCAESAATTPDACLEKIYAIQDMIDDLYRRKPTEAVMWECQFMFDCIHEELTKHDEYWNIQQQRDS